MTPTRRQVAGALALGAAGIATGGCTLLGMRWRYRYRLTAEIDTPEGVHSGSGVIKVVRSKGYREIGGAINGEAVAVDLPGQRTLFLLLRDSSSADWPIYVPEQAFRDQLDEQASREERLTRLEQMQGASAVLAPKDYPAMAWFRDIRDAATLTLVDPGNLSAAFGPGYAVKRLWVAMTNDRATRGILKKIPRTDARGFGTATVGGYQVLSRDDFTRTQDDEL